MAIIRASIPLTIYRGDTFWKVLQIKDGDDPEDEYSEPIDLTNVELSGMARVEPNDAPWFTLPIKITDGRKGKFEIKLKPEETTRLGAQGQPRSGRYDIQMRDKSSGDVFTAITGSVTFTDDYTY